MENKTISEILEGSMLYSRTDINGHREAWESVQRDRAALGRILFDLTAANANRADFEKLGVADPLNKRQFDEIFQFLDRLNWMLTRLDEHYHNEVMSEMESRLAGRSNTRTIRTTA